VPPGELDRVERSLLLHLLEHHGQQVRFEASQWVTEFGIVRQFASEPSDVVRRALRSLEMGRLIYRRTQYVVGYSEPKHVFSLTPSGLRKAIELRTTSPSPSDGGRTDEDAGSRSPPGPHGFDPGGASDPSEGTEPTV
jgi:hypothetical protein